MKNTLVFETTFVVIECTRAGCGVHFALTEHYRNQRRDDHATFYCPNGHGHWYPGESDLEKARAATLRAEAQRDFARQERDRAEAERVKVERKLKRERKRVAASVCPCCNRSFMRETAMARHIATKHAEYTA